jgi:hypothetical protein
MQDKLHRALKKVISRRDLSHLPAENRIIEITKGVVDWVNRNLFTAEQALKPKRKLKQSEITPEVKKMLDEIEAVSDKARKDIAKIRETLDNFVNKYAEYLEIPF